MGARLVLAEPDARLREVLALLLRREGHSVLTAQDGADALALIRRKLPDLAVLRGAMPDPDGVALAHRLAREPATARLPVILLSFDGATRDLDPGPAGAPRAWVSGIFIHRLLIQKIEELLAATPRPPARWRIAPEFEDDEDDPPARSPRKRRRKNRRRFGAPEDDDG
jgi:CheY-like chemotaxis protein